MGNEKKIGLAIHTRRISLKLLIETDFVNYFYCKKFYNSETSYLDFPLNNVHLLKRIYLESKYEERFTLLKHLNRK